MVCVMREMFCFLLQGIKKCWKVQTADHFWCHIRHILSTWIFGPLLMPSPCTEILTIVSMQGYQRTPLYHSMHIPLHLLVGQQKVRFCTNLRNERHNYLVPTLQAMMMMMTYFVQLPLLIHQMIFQHFLQVIPTSNYTILVYLPTHFGNIQLNHLTSFYFPKLRKILRNKPYALMIINNICKGSTLLIVLPFQYKPSTCEGTYYQSRLQGLDCELLQNINNNQYVNPLSVYRIQLRTSIHQKAALQRHFSSSFLGRDY